MELLHDSSGLVGSLNCQLKRLEEKIDTSRPVALMKDLHRLEETIKELEERTEPVTCSTDPTQLKSLSA